MRDGFRTLGTSLLAVFWLTGQVATAQHLSDELVTKVALPLIEDNIVDGISIGYIERDREGIVHLGTATSAGRKADNLTVYELGSISKVFTGLLLADAVVRGELNLHATANADNAAGIRLPSHKGRSIQWIDLSTHRSGLPRLPGNIEVTSLKDPYRLYDSKKAASALANFKLARKPGEMHEYSNFGTSVLGYLIAENAKTTYQKLLQERIAMPLGMKDCIVELTRDQKQRSAIPHSKIGLSTSAWTFADMPGAGGIRATMSDMMKFAKAQLNPPPGKLGEAIDLAWKQHSAADASGSATGLGWMIHADGATRWHNGGTGGSRSAIFINRRIKSAVIVLCNTAVTDEVDGLAVQLLQTAAGIKTNIQHGKMPPKVSPFTSVGMHGDLVFVTYDGTTYQWLKLDGIKVTEIVASAKKQFGGLWQKRIREDLVEVLWGMGHKPEKTVKLRLQDVETKQETVVDSAIMTAKNRAAIRAESRRADSSEMEERNQGKIVVDAKHRARLVGRYKLANFIFDVEDRDGHLMVRLSGQQFNEVFPDSETKWSYRGIDAMIEFKLGRSGPATQLTLHQNGVKQVATRVGK